jgi:hypothetical protein
MQQHGGGSFSNGQYRLNRLDEIPAANRMIAEVFSEYEQKVVCFAFDWLGRGFGLDASRTRDGEMLVALFEPGSGEVLKAPVTFSEFHQVELVEYRNDSVASEFHQQWLDAGGAPPNREECIGYKVPLFLNGSDTVDNLEKQDLQVYWSICGQLLSAR